MLEGAAVLKQSPGAQAMVVLVVEVRETGGTVPTVWVAGAAVNTLLPQAALAARVL
jgi:hypothetical protein